MTLLTQCYFKEIFLREEQYFHRTVLRSQSCADGSVGLVMTLERGQGRMTFYAVHSSSVANLTFHENLVNLL